MALFYSSLSKLIQVVTMLLNYRHLEVYFKIFMNLEMAGNNFLKAEILINVKVCSVQDWGRMRNLFVFSCKIKMRPNQFCELSVYLQRKRFLPIPQIG